MTGIYKITNKTNGKVYVGQAQDIFKRWREHEKGLLKNSHHNHKLQKAFNESDDGIDNFDFDILERCEICDLDRLEVKYMKEYDVLNDDKGYNIHTEGIKNEDELKKTKIKKEQKCFLIKEEDLGLYDEEYKNNINSKAKVNIYSALQLMFQYYKYMESEIIKHENSKEDDFFYKDRMRHSFRYDISRSMKYMYLGKEGFFKYTQYHHSGACYYTMKKSHYDNTLKEEMYNSWIAEINPQSLKWVRLVDILRLINKLNGYSFDKTSSYSVLVYIKIIGLYFLGEDFYKYYGFEDVYIDGVKDIWNGKYNIWGDKK